MNLKIREFVQSILPDSIQFSLDDQTTRDALRMAIQSSVAAASQYIVMQMLGMPEKFVGILSATLVLSPSIGSTLVSAQQRFVATLVGCVIGITGFAILPDGYGIAFLLAVGAFVMNFVAGYYPRWQYGLVAVVALVLQADSDPWQTAVDRLLSIGLGVFIGTIASIVIWPERTTTRVKRYLNSALDAVGDLLANSIRSATEDDEHSELMTIKRRYSREISNARKAVAGIRIADGKGLEKKIEMVERLYDAIVILERVSTESLEQGGVSEMADSIQQVRKNACQVISDVRDRTHAAEQHLKELRDDLNSYRDGITSGEVSDSELLQQAMHFGFNEVEDSLSRYIQEND